MGFFEMSWVSAPIDPRATTMSYVRIGALEVPGDTIYFERDLGTGDIRLVPRSACPKPLAVLPKGEEELAILVRVDRFERLLLEWGIGVRDLIRTASDLRNAAEVLES